jgi:hypothetical protein
MVVGSKGQGESKTESGIIEGHAYTLIGCHLINGEKVSSILKNYAFFCLFDVF